MEGNVWLCHTMIYIITRISVWAQTRQTYEKWAIRYSIDKQYNIVTQPTVITHPSVLTLSQADGL